MCPKKQFYHHKNIWTVSIVKFEFLGYNGLNVHTAEYHQNCPSSRGLRTVLVTRGWTLNPLLHGLANFVPAETKTFFA